MMRCKTWLFYDGIGKRKTSPNFKLEISLQPEMQQADIRSPHNSKSRVLCFMIALVEFILKFIYAISIDYDWAHGVLELRLSVLSFWGLAIGWNLCVASLNWIHFPALIVVSLAIFNNIRCNLDPTLMCGHLVTRHPSGSWALRIIEVRHIPLLQVQLLECWLQLPFAVQGIHSIRGSHNHELC